MAFIIENNTTISFAEYSDVKAADQRLFDSNEGLTDDVVETALIRATERILNKMRSSQWWRNYWLSRNDNPTIKTVADVPALDIDKILDRHNDFTDLAVYWALSEIILPQVANFGDDADDDKAKMGYYQNKTERLFDELIVAGDWYDFNDDSTISSSEKSPGYVNLKRVR
jgi:hypothetical protein